VTAEALLAGSYGAALLVAALLLEWLSSHTHRRALRFRTAGFTYHRVLDAWICPEGEHLWPHEFDQERRLVRYRARAHVCNACPAKHRCTDSSDGREVVRPLDPWPHSEAGRFHRVIALMLVTLACLVGVVALVRNHAAPSVALLGGLLACGAAEARWLLRDLRRQPAPRL
jgi:Transposase DDE domain